MIDTATVQLFTDAQSTALCAVIGTGFGGLAVAVRWAINRVVKSIDLSTEARIRSAEASAAQAAALNLAAARVDEVYGWIMRTGTGKTVSR